VIISKTPYRISFFGGGTDYPSWYRKNGGSVLSTTIDKFIYISCRNLPPFFNHKYRIVWSHIETVKNLQNIKHKAVREMLKKYKINNGLEIHYDGDLPARSGMGSSSVFVVGLMNLLSNFNGKIKKKYQLARDSINFEQKTLKEIVGSQDQIAAAFGGFNKIIFNTNGTFKVLPLNVKKKTLQKLNKNLLLIYTGMERTAHYIAKSYVNKLKTTKKKNILKISDFVVKAEKALKKEKLDDFGRLLHRAWLEKKKLSNSISSKKIDKLYYQAIKNGALGGKLLGAGGGGFFVFYVPKNRQKKFIRSFKKFITIPFKFTSEGSKIMFNNFEN